MVGRITFHPTGKSVAIAIVLTFVNGYLDAYTYLACDGVFAGAQTGNLILMAISVVQGNTTQAIRHLPPLIAFIAGVAVAEGLRRRPLKLGAPSAPESAIFIEWMLLVAASVGAGASEKLVSSLIAIALAFQVTSFGTLGCWKYNSTLGSADLGAVGQSAVHAFFGGDQDVCWTVSKFVLGMVAFLVGAATGGALTLIWHHYAILGAIVALGAMPLLLRRSTNMFS
jgi:uncharacterized membrane protein YoaK (UPF0700 family)